MLLIGAGTEKARLAFARPAEHGGCQGLFFGYCCQMILICNLFFCLRSPFYFSELWFVVREACEFSQKLGCRGPNAPGLGHAAVKLRCQLLSLGLVLPLASAGRQAGRQAPVNAATMGRAAFLINEPWCELRNDDQRSQWPKVIFKKGKDCFKLFSLNFIVIFCVPEHRAEGWEDI